MQRWQTDKQYSKKLSAYNRGRDTKNGERKVSERAWDEIYQLGSAVKFDFCKIYSRAEMFIRCQTRVCLCVIPTVEFLSSSPFDMPYEVK